MNERLQALADAGVSIWLDDLSRERIESGNLAELVTEGGVVGVTTNPTIFASALSDGDRYAAQVAELKAAGADVDETVFALTTTDVREACDVLRPVHDRTDGVDGRVSIEVDPGAARDTARTTTIAKRLWETVDRPNLLIKIPATVEGLPAIADAIAEGISVNVTLIFSLERYRAVMDAYVDGRLEEGDPLRGKAAIANARLAYEAFEEVFGSERFGSLRERGARPQRPLWASTGVKDPAYPDTLYVTELVVADTVNTMPEKTLQAFADHGEVEGDRVTGRYDESRQVIADLEAKGIGYDEVVAKLEKEGLEKFDASWAELLDSVRSELEKA